MTIKHLVIPGGAHNGLKSLGVLQHLEETGFWNINDIQSIYATSIGSVIAVFLSMRFDRETINDYIIKRPWNEAFHISIDDIFAAFSQRGLFNKKRAIETFFKPLFDAKDIDIEITLAQFFEIYKIDLHFFSLEINAFELTDVSHKTHPTISLLTAVQMSSALPVLISPVCIDNKCFVDGGFICNYPINKCIESVENTDEIFGIKIVYINVNSECNTIVTDSSSMLDYIINFFNKLINNISNDKIQSIPNEISYETTSLNFTNIKMVVCSQEIRKNMINMGIEYAKTFLADQNREKHEIVPNL